MFSLKADLLKWYKRAFEQNLMQGTSGNASVYDKKNNIVYITPSGAQHDTMTIDDIVKIDIDGNVLNGDKKPSVEWPLHTEVYKQCDTKAVFHTHSPFATAYSVIDKPIPFALAEMGYWTNGEIPVSRYAPIGSKELGINVASLLNKQDRTTCLLQSHGTVAIGETIELAFVRATYIEDAAHICSIASGLGEIKTLG